MKIKDFFVGRSSFSKIEEFKKLTKPQRIVTGFAVGIISIFTLGLFSMPSFKSIVGRFKKMNDDKVAKAAKAALSIPSGTIPTRAPNLNPNLNPNPTPISGSGTIPTRAPNLNPNPTPISGSGNSPRPASPTTKQKELATIFEEDEYTKALNEEEDEYTKALNEGNIKKAPSVLRGILGQEGDDISLLLISPEESILTSYDPNDLKMFEIPEGTHFLVVSYLQLIEERACLFEEKRSTEGTLSGKQLKYFKLLTNSLKNALQEIDNLSQLEKILEKSLANPEIEKRINESFAYAKTLQGT